jgi:hypothetical protein
VQSTYGASKAALETATEVWAKEVEGAGLTINIVNPGAGANTPGMAEEMRAMSREGRAPRVVEPGEMVPPLLYVVSREPTRSTAGASTPTFGTGLCRPPKPPAAPASNCTRSRVDQEARASEAHLQRRSLCRAGSNRARAMVLAYHQRKRLLSGNGQRCWRGALLTGASGRSRLVTKIDERDDTAHSNRFHVTAGQIICGLVE